MIQKLANWFDSLSLTASILTLIPSILLLLTGFFGAIFYAGTHQNEDTSFKYFNCIDNNKSIRKESLSSGSYIKEYPCDQYLPKN